MNCCFVAPMHTIAFTLSWNFGAKSINKSPLSDPQTMRRRLRVSPYDPSAASRLCELVDLESSTNMIPFFSHIFSSLCGSPEISEMYFFTRFEHIFISLATSAQERIFRALCIHESCVSESLYFFLPEIMISSPSVLSFFQD